MVGLSFGCFFVCASKDRRSLFFTSIGNNHSRGSDILGRDNRDRDGRCFGPEGEQKISFDFRGHAG